MAVEMVLIAGYVQHADQFATGIHNRCGGTGQEMVGRQIMLSGMNHRGRLLGNCGTNRIRTFALL